MQAIVLRPQRGQIMGMLVCIAALTVGMAAAPALCLPLGMAMPLFACPLVGTSRQWAAIAAALIAPLVSLVYGAPTLYAFSLLFACGAPVAAAFLLRPQKAATDAAFVYYIAAYAFSMSLVLLSVRGLLKGNPAMGIAGLLTEAVAGSPNAGELLYRLAASGLISVPRDYQGKGMLFLMLDPVLTRQLVLSLRLTMELIVERLLPGLIVHGCLLGAVFTTLRVQRLNHSYLLVDEKHKEQVKLAVTPGFSMLALPRGGGVAMALTGLAALIFATVDNSWFQTLSALMLAAFQGVFELVGAAALVGLLARRRPQAKTAFGVLAAGLYLLLPSTLLLLGIMDSMLHFRTKNPFEPKEEE